MVGGLAVRTTGGLAVLRIIGAGVAMLAVGAVLIRPLLVEAGARAIDWQSYLSGTQRFLAGQPLYIPEQFSPHHLLDVAGRGYVYPPPSVLLFLPIVPLGYTGWALLSIAVLVTGIAAMCRSFAEYRWVATGLALTLIAASWPYTEGVIVGNVNVPLAGAFAWAFALGRRGAWPAAVGAIVKLHPAALAAWSKSLIRSGLIAAALVVLTIWMPWVDYVRAMLNVRPLCDADFTMAPALSCTVGQPIALAAAAALVLIARWLPWDGLAFALVCVAVVLPQPEVFGHTTLFLEIGLLGLIAGTVKRPIPLEDGP